MNVIQPPSSTRCSRRSVSRESPPATLEAAYKANANTMPAIEPIAVRAAVRPRLHGTVDPSVGAGHVARRAAAEPAADDGFGDHEADREGKDDVGSRSRTSCRRSRIRTARRSGRRPRRGPRLRRTGCHQRSGRHRRLAAGGPVPATRPRSRSPTVMNVIQAPSLITREEIVAAASDYPLMAPLHRIPDGGEHDACDRTDRGPGRRSAEAPWDTRRRA